MMKQAKQEMLAQETRTIQLSLPFHLGSVNCYLIKTGSGFVLIDTGSSNQRAALERELMSAGCTPGALRLIAIIHGDFDHTGNAAYLREKFGVKIAMHAADAGMLEHGDMFWNRKKGNKLIQILAPVLFRFDSSNRCKPDLLIGDGYDLSEFGYEARVLEIPGHSRGSIGILSTNGDLFCGDLLDNTARPVLNSIMDDIATANASVEKLKKLKIDTVYPGHGKPFSMELLSI